jgi:hypothetical protein
MNVLQAMDDPNLFAPWFKQKSWDAWRCYLSALFVLPMNEKQLAIYREHTGRSDLPQAQANESFLICGRRSGKSLTAALIAVFLAAFRDYSAYLAPGETGVVMVIASDRKQARVILNYIDAFFERVPMLAKLVASRTMESVTLATNIRVEIHTSSFRSIRGYTVCAAILDELAFFETGDAASPDVEIVNALRPAMSTIPNALLLGVSSPYARRGLLWQTFKSNYGQANAESLVWRAPTKSMNPTVSSLVIAAAYVRDAAAAAAEYGAEFRSDIAGFLTEDVLERCTVQLTERPPLNAMQYYAFVDPSGGLADSFTLAIAHFEREKAVLDFLREIPAPFSPEAAVEALVQDLRRFRITEVYGDAYGGSWPAEQFQKRGVAYYSSELVRSELYLELLPALSAGSVELLASPRLQQQFMGLERRTSRIGRDLVDHAPGGHDDAANCVAGVLVRVLAANAQPQLHPLFRMFSGAAAEIEARFARVRAELRQGYDEAAARHAAAAPKPEGACPECGMFLRSNVSGTERCNQCGHTFSTPECRVYYASRGEMLARADGTWQGRLGERSWWQR